MVPNFSQLLYIIYIVRKLTLALQIILNGKQSIVSGTENYVPILQCILNCATKNGNTLQSVWYVKFHKEFAINTSFYYSLEPGHNVAIRKIGYHISSRYITVLEKYFPIIIRTALDFHNFFLHLDDLLFSVYFYLLIFYY